MTTDVRGGTIAVTDAPNGKVWAQQADHPAPINTDDADASISDVPGAVTTVDSEGNVHAVSAEAGRVTSDPPIPLWDRPRGTRRDAD